MNNNQSEYDEYKKYLRDVSAAYPYLLDLPEEFMHCLTENEAKLALLIKSHNKNNQALNFEIIFKAETSSKQVHTDFGNNNFLGTSKDLTIRFEFEGNWYLRLSKQTLDIDLGCGILVLHATDYENNYIAKNNLGIHQIGFIQLSNTNKLVGFSSEKLVGDFYLNRMQLIDYLTAINHSNFYVSTTKTIPCSPGFISSDKESQVFGPIYSIAASSIQMTTELTLRESQKSTGNFYLKMIGAPTNKLELAKYINELSNLGIAEIATNLKEISETGWYFFNTTDIEQLISVYKDAVSLGGKVEILNHPK